MGIRTRRPLGELEPQRAHEAPFGGYKQIGIGREMGMHAVNLHTEVKNVYNTQE